MKSKKFRERFRNRRTRRVYNRQKTYKNRNQKVGGTNNMVSVLNNTRKVMQTVKGVLTIGEYTFEPTKKMSGGDWKDVSILHNKVTLIPTHYQNVRDIQKKMGGNNQLVSKYGENARIMETIPGKLSIFLFENAQFEPKKEKVPETKPIISIVLKNPSDNILPKPVIPRLPLEKIINDSSSESDSIKKKGQHPFKTPLLLPQKNNYPNQIVEKPLHVSEVYTNSQQPLQLSTRQQPAYRIGTSKVPILPNDTPNLLLTSPGNKKISIPTPIKTNSSVVELSLQPQEYSDKEKPIKIENKKDELIKISPEEKKKIQDIFNSDNNYLDFTYLNTLNSDQTLNIYLAKGNAKIQKAIRFVYKKNKGDLKIFLNKTIKKIEENINKDNKYNNKLNAKLKQIRVMDELFKTETKILKEEQEAQEARDKAAQVKKKENK